MTSQEIDVEKGRVLSTPVEPTGASATVAPESYDHDHESLEESTYSESKLSVWARRVEKVTGVEARGISRVDESEKSQKSTLSFLQIVILWLSINTAAQNITLASIGNSVFGLGFVDAACCSVFGCMIGAIPAAYTATWGPVSGNRTLIFARYTMGWWPTKICVLLYIVILLGYSMIDAVVAGQILSAVSTNDKLSVVAGIIIVSAVTWIVTTFGIKIFHYYERYAWIPQYAVLLILAGTAGNKFDIHSQSEGNPITITGNRLSFFSVCLSSAITYAPGSADFLVYCSPKITSRWKVFTAVYIGMSLSFAFCMVLGCGLGSGIATNPNWAAAGGGSGALIVAGYEDLGGFGSFCSVVVGLGLIANMVPPVYSSGIDFQILGRYPAMVPRFIWNTFGVIVFAICALAGKDHLAEIFTNFLALMGYWVAIWIAITLEEQLIFRRQLPIPYVWTDWNKQEKLPRGIAAFIAFCIGWAGAVLCMAQVYYIGPLARLVGDYGGDMGNFVGFGLAALVYPPLRYLELKKFGR